MARLAAQRSAPPHAAPLTRNPHDRKPFVTAPKAFRDHTPTANDSSKRLIDSSYWSTFEISPAGDM
ncbi:hypothetical protein WJ50_31420 [Burkholderia ubonensis]|nr:hypothetical protein WJ50_31420 [Burkholderia ubonensis]